MNPREGDGRAESLRANFIPTAGKIICFPSERQCSRGPHLITPEASGVDAAPEAGRVT